MSDILERLDDTELNTSSDLWHLRKDAIAEIKRLQDALDTCRELREYDSNKIERLQAFIERNGLHYQERR